MVRIGKSLAAAARGSPTRNAADRGPALQSRTKRLVAALPKKGPTWNA